MSLRTILLVLLAAVSGMSAAVGVKRLRQQPAGPAADTVPIVVAAAALPRGDTVSAQAVAIREYPKDLVPDGAITQIHDALQRVALVPLAKGDPLVETKLAAKGLRGLETLVPKGMRAFTITTSLVSGVAGFILPGNRVDVLLTVTNNGSDDATGGGSTMTLLQNVEILAVDQRVEAPVENRVDPKELRSVTLLVTPDQAERLDLGQNKGTLHLSLRHPGDSSPAVTHIATIKDLQYHKEKSWDERVVGLAGAFAKAMAALPKEKAARPSVPAPPRETIPVEKVQTLKGTFESWVLLQAPPNVGMGR
jgi:pilus assembly protein CpaB